HSPHVHRPLHSFPTRRSSDLYPYLAQYPPLTSKLCIACNVATACLRKQQLCNSCNVCKTCVRYQQYIRRFQLSQHPVVTKADALDRKSTRLNSSHVSISYAVF